MSVRKGRLLPGLAAAALLLAGPQAAPAATGGLDGFDAESALEFSRNGGGAGLVQLDEAQREHVRRLVVAGQSLRDNLASDIGALRAALDPEEQAVLDRVVASDDASTEADMWRYFFQGSLIYLGHGLAETSRLGYYNPIADAWVLADVAASEAGGMRLVEMAAVTGDWIRGEAGEPSAAPVYVRDPDQVMANALAENHARTVAAFLTRYPLLAETEPPAPAGNAAEFALTRARLLLIGTTIGSLRVPAYRAVIDALRQRIVEGDARALRASMSAEPPVPLQRITGLPTPARELLRPTGYFRRDQGMTIAFGVPFTGRWVVLADFEEPVGDAAPALENLLLLDLVAAEGRLK